MYSTNADHSHTVVSKKDINMNKIFTCAFVPSNINTVFVRVSPVCLTNSLFVSNKHTNRPGKSGTSRYTRLLVSASTQIPPVLLTDDKLEGYCVFQPPVLPTRPAAIHYKASNCCVLVYSDTPSVDHQPHVSSQKGPCRFYRLAELDLEAEAVAGFTLGWLAGAGAVPFGTLWVGWGEKENRSQGPITLWAFF